MSVFYLADGQTDIGDSNVCFADKNEKCRPLGEEEPGIPAQYDQLING